MAEYSQTYIDMKFLVDIVEDMVLDGSGEDSDDDDPITIVVPRFQQPAGQHH